MGYDGYAERARCVCAGQGYKAAFAKDDVRRYAAQRLLSGAYALRELERDS